jgi:hypothetical protein
MCGQKLKLAWLPLVLALLLPLPSWCESYTITESELQEIEKLLTMQEADLTMLLELTSKQAKQLQDQSTIIEGLEASLTASAREAMVQSIKIGTVTFAIGVGVGALGVVIAILR